MFNFRFLIPASRRVQRFFTALRSLSHGYVYPYARAGRLLHSRSLSLFLLFSSRSRAGRPTFARSLFTRKLMVEPPARVCLSLFSREIAFRNIYIRERPAFFATGSTWNEEKIWGKRWEGFGWLRARAQSIRA